MTYDFSTIGALIGLALAIFLIVKQVPPVYSLLFGALVGGLVGGGGLSLTVDTMINGSRHMCCNCYGDYCESVDEERGKSCN